MELVTHKQSNVETRDKSSIGACLAHNFGSNYATKMARYILDLPRGFLGAYNYQIAQQKFSAQRN